MARIAPRSTVPLPSALFLSHRFLQIADINLTTLEVASGIFVVDLWIVPTVIAGGVIAGGLSQSFRDRRLHALRHREGMGESWRSYRRGYGRRFIFGADFASPQVFASARVPGQPAPPTLIQLLQF